MDSWAVLLEVASHSCTSDVEVSSQGFGAPASGIYHFSVGLQGRCGVGFWFFGGHMAIFSEAASFKGAIMWMHLLMRESLS